MNKAKLHVEAMRRLFERTSRGRRRSVDLQKLAPLVWPLIVGVAKLQPDYAWFVGNQLQFAKAGQIYLVRMRHISDVLRLPRRFEICKAVGTRSIPVRSFATLAQAEAFARRPVLS